MLNVKSEVNFEIVRRFTEEGFEIPFNQNDVTLTNVGEVADAIAKVISAGQGKPNSGKDTGESE